MNLGLAESYTPFSIPSVVRLTLERHPDLACKRVRKTALERDVESHFDLSPRCTKARLRLRD